MTNLQFTDFQCHDDRPTLTREEAIGRTLGFAGIHERTALSWLCESFSGGVSDVSTVSEYDFGHDEGTWAVAEDHTLSGTAPDSSQWYKILYTGGEIEPGFEVTFDKTGDCGGFVFCADTDYDPALLAWWDGTAVGFSSLVGTTETVLLSLPCAALGASTVTVAVWPRSYSRIDEIDDLAMALFFDGRLTAQHVTDNSDEFGEHIGFAVGCTSVATYDDIRIPQLHQIQEWTSVDPGEAASAGMNRVTGQDLIRVQARFDGSVKIWRNDETDVDWEVPAGNARRASKKHQLYAPSHLRLVGGAHEVNVFRHGEQGHVFVVAQDPHALSEDDTYDRAVRQHRRVTETADTLTLELTGLNVLLEPEDVLEYNDVKWRVQTIGYRITSRAGEGGGHVVILDSTVECRHCLES